MGWGLHLWTGDYTCGLGITLVGWGLHLWAGDYICGLGITLVGWGLHLWAGDCICGLGITLVGWGLHLWAGDYTSGQSKLAAPGIEPTTSLSSCSCHVRMQGRLLTLGWLWSFHHFAVCSSSAHEVKIIIFERFQCSLIKAIQLN